MEQTPEEARTNGPSSPPALRLLFWEMTARCNLACVHCRRLDTPEPAAADEFDTAAALEFVDQAAACGRPLLVLSGGEPLLRPDLFEIVAHAVKRKLPVSLATNGTLIDEATADGIAASEIRRVAVSLDGPDAETHDAFRGLPGSLEAALAGCRRLRRRGVSLQFNCTVTGHNLDKRREIHETAVREGADALHFFVLVPVGCGLKLPEEKRLSAVQVEEFLNWTADLSLESPLHLKVTCAPQYFRIRRQKGLPPAAAHPGRSPHGSAAGTSRRSAGKDRAMLEAVTRGCLAGSGICFVSHQGDVFPCGYLPLCAGNVRKKPLREIWATAGLFQKLRDPSRLTGKCGVCGYKQTCFGCRARALAVFGDEMAADPYCAYTPPKRRGDRK